MTHIRVEDQRFVYLRNVWAGIAENHVRVFVVIRTSLRRKCGGWLEKTRDEAQYECKAANYRLAGHGCLSEEAARVWDESAADGWNVENGGKCMLLLVTLSQQGRKEDKCF